MHAPDNVLAAQTADAAESQSRWLVACYGFTYRGHGSVAPEPSADTVVDTLRLAPFRGQTVEPVGLMSVEGLRACMIQTVSIIIVQSSL